MCWGLGFERCSHERVSPLCKGVHGFSRHALYWLAMVIVILMLMRKLMLNTAKRLADFEALGSDQGFGLFHGFVVWVGLHCDAKAQVAKDAQFRVV